MNNSLVANLTLENPPVVDNTVKLRQRESELLAIIEAIDKIADSAEWAVLKEKVFDGVVTGLLKQRDIEIEKKPLNGPMIHSLNGQLAWAKKYSNFDSLALIYKQELINVRKQYAT